MSQIASIIVSAVLFILIMIIFTKEKYDYVSITLLAAIIACIVTGFSFGVGFGEFKDFIELEPIFFIICMQIVVTIAQENKIFQWIVLKTLHLTKGDHRKFFYIIGLMASMSSAIVSDITVGIIFVPIVIRACRILKINPAPYLFGLSFTINIGSIYTPVSSSENILIASAFGLDFSFFISHFTLIVIPTLLYTLFLVDVIMLRKQEPPPDEQKIILLEIMDPGLVIVEPKKFKINFTVFLLIIIGFILIPESYLVAAIGALVMIFINNQNFGQMLGKIDLKVISFFVGIFLLMGTMQINGTFDILGSFIGSILPQNHLFAAIVVLFMIAIMSGFLAQVPTALVFIALLNDIYGAGNVPIIIIMALLLGINIGSNFLPQGAACDLITLNLAKENDVKDFNYNSLLKNGSMMTLIHLGFSVLALIIYSCVL